MNKPDQPKTPRPYLSHSQKVLFDKSPKRYYEIYILGHQPPGNKYTYLGKEFSEMMEKNDPVANPLWEMVRVLAPDEPKREYEIRADAEGIPLLAKMDRFNPYSKPKRIREQKTGKRWTQAMADKNEQLTHYAYVCYLAYGVIPDLFLDWFKTEEDADGKIKLTGEMRTFETRRTVRDFLWYYRDLEKTWKGIIELCKDELL